MRSACFSALARLAAPLLAAAVAGCATDKDPMERQLSKLRDQVAELQNDTDRMGERLDAMEVRHASAARQADDRVAATTAAGTLSRPKLKIVRVEPGSDMAADDTTGAPDELAPESDGPRVVIQGEGKSLETRTVATAPTAAKSAPAKAPKNDKAEKSDAGKAQKPEAQPSK
jgi:hypothetical protein